MAPVVFIYGRRDPIDCGGICLIVETPDNQLYCLIVEEEESIYGFPKGHIEPDDKNRKETALRELYEEAGKDVANIVDFNNIICCIRAIDTHIFVLYTKVASLPQLKTEEKDTVRKAYWHNLSTKMPKNVNRTIRAFKKYEKKIMSKIPYTPKVNMKFLTNLIEGITTYNDKLPI